MRRMASALKSRIRKYVYFYGSLYSLAEQVAAKPVCFYLRSWQRMRGSMQELPKESDSFGISPVDRLGQRLIARESHDSSTRVLSAAFADHNESGISAKLQQYSI